MSDRIQYVIGLLRWFIPLIALLLLNELSVMKKEERSKQFLLPIIAVIYSLMIGLLQDSVSGWVQSLVLAIPRWIQNLGAWLGQYSPNFVQSLGRGVGSFGNWLQNLIATSNMSLLVFAAYNALVVLAFILIKRSLFPIFRRVFRDGNDFYEKASGLFYRREAMTGTRFLRRDWLQARGLISGLFWTVLIFGIIAGMYFIHLLLRQSGLTLYYPVYAMVILAEVRLFLKGPEDSREGSVGGDDDGAEHVSDYSSLREVLRRLFGDKLAAEGTTEEQKPDAPQSNEALLSQMKNADSSMDQAYGLFMQGQSGRGLELDHSYLKSGLNLLHGESILFNNPFYYDLIPYLFYPMNRALLTGRKVLVVLGRHGTESDIHAWCEEGLFKVTNLPELWRIGKLEEEPKDLDVGILTRSDVHDLKLHEANQAFFSQVGFVVLIEPSKLITTAQVGLHSIVQHCRQGGKNITYCSTDKNCDGLVDALSHVLLTSLTEVSASRHHSGASSYMCWEVDDERTQNRMLPDISRYLGMGTELSFAALKNQVSHTDWYGGSAFPVLDIRWIAFQYYYPLLTYAGCSPTQDTMDRVFRVDPNLWKVRRQDEHYLIVEDESFNMFELRRVFSTRAKKQGFVNVLSTDYLLREYMADNDTLFENDPKAIPCIVADYDRTVRNVALRLCLRLSTVPTPEDQVRRELLLVDAAGLDTAAELWHQICRVHQPIGVSHYDVDGAELLVLETKRGTTKFRPEVIQTLRRFDMEQGRMINCLFIDDRDFIQLVLSCLQSARYIAEDEAGSPSFLGSEIQGQIYQRTLPGQLITLEGKYYEMLRGTKEGQILVRRAADHISGRTTYRQIRTYTFFGLENSTLMGDVRQVGGLTLTNQYADIRVEVSSYWAMSRYNDFTTAKRVTVNGIPQRSFCSKRVLRIGFDQDLQPSNQVLHTLSLLINEAFRTLFAENQCFITAVVPGEGLLQEPASLFAQGDVALEANCIYLIEDSQLDIGLLTAAERNLQRILAIICDYLDWHFEAVEKSENPPSEPPVQTPVAEPDDGEEQMTSVIQEEEKIKSGRLRNFFRRLLRRDKGKDQQRPPLEPEGITTQTSTGEQTSQPPVHVPEIGEESTDTQPDNGAGSVEGSQETSSTPRDNNSDQETNTIEDITGAKGVLQADTVSYEPEGAVPAEEATGVTAKIKRQPYHLRYFLLYGGTAVPQGVELWQTLELLRQLGMENNGLYQARKQKDMHNQIEGDYIPNLPGVHYCDFCGKKLTGTEYEVLRDGRERCMECGRTAIRTEQEFVNLYCAVRKEMERRYRIKIHMPVDVKMVSAKRIQKERGKTFIPTPGFDNRAVGIAIGSGDKRSILIENGAPRVSAVSTIVHELTHIWQYENWNQNKTYGRYPNKRQELVEGMATWAETQYLYLTGEKEEASRMEASYRIRKDEYGRGFRSYVAVYPMVKGSRLNGSTPFTNPEFPIPPDKLEIGSVTFGE